jgi:hypothetical protein
MGFSWSHAVDGAIGDSFDIFFETDDIIDFSSYKKGKEILVKYHVVNRIEIMNEICAR